MDDRLRQLAEGEIEIPDNPVELERLLVGSEAAPESGSDVPKDEDAEPVGDPPAETPPADPPASAAPAKPADPPPADPVAATPPETPPKNDPPPAEPPAEGPPPVVLRKTRERLHAAERDIADREAKLAAERERAERLERELQQLKAGGASSTALKQAAEAAKTGDRAKLEALRDELDDSVVEFLGGLLDELETTRTTVKTLTAQREQTEAEKLQADIDSVPLLAAIDATRSPEADALWKRASAYERVVKADPDFADASQAEVFAEVGRRMERHLGPEGTAKWLGKEPPAATPPATPSGAKPPAKTTVEDKLAAARERAAPTSLSDLPAGSPAAQTGAERLDTASYFDLEAAIGKAAERGSEAVDELIQRLATTDR